MVLSQEFFLLTRISHPKIISQQLNYISQISDSLPLTQQEAAGVSLRTCLRAEHKKMEQYRSTWLHKDK